MKSERIELDTDSSLDGGGSLAARLEQKKEEGNGRLAQYHSIKKFEPPMDADEHR
jgi:hypothetical protein